MSTRVYMRAPPRFWALIWRVVEHRMVSLAAVSPLEKVRYLEIELAGTRPAHARAPPGAPSPVKLRQTFPRDAFRRYTKSKYRDRY